MITYKKLHENRQTKACFIFGRFNPPTVGHNVLVDKLISEARKTNSDAFVFMSTSQDKKKNPLSFNQKLDILQKIYFNKHRDIFRYTSMKPVSPWHICTLLYNEGYREVSFIVGSDRVSEFTKSLLPYNGVEGKHGYFNFTKLDVIKAGDRDPDADDISGMSASKLRKYALEGDYANFVKGMDSNLLDQDKKNVYNIIRDVMKHAVKEDTFNAIKTILNIKPLNEDNVQLDVADKQLTFGGYDTKYLSEFAIDIFEQVADHNLLLHEPYVFKHLLMSCDKFHQIYYEAVEFDECTVEMMQEFDKHVNKSVSLYNELDMRSGLLHGHNLGFTDQMRAKILEVLKKTKNKPLEDGTNELVKTYKDMTPGQEDSNISESIQDVQMISQSLMNAAVMINRLEKDVTEKLGLDFKRDFVNIRNVLKQMKNKIQYNRQPTQNIFRKNIGPQYRQFN